MAEVDGETLPAVGDGWDARAWREEALHRYRQGIHALDRADRINDPEAPPVAMSVIAHHYTAATAMFTAASAASAIVAALSE